MNRTLVIEPEATAEIDRAADWYHQHNEPAAIGFRDAVDKAFDFIREHPEQYQIVYRQCAGRWWMDIRTPCFTPSLRHK